MRTGVIRITAALFALALLVGVFAGLFTQPAQAVKRVSINSGFASVPAARAIDVVTRSWTHAVQSGDRNRQ